MTHTTAARSRARAPWFAHPIVSGGTAAGLLDILAAFGYRGAYGVSPTRVLQGIASGVLGPASFQGGPSTAALGLLLHFVIAFGAAVVYYVASRGFPVLARRPVPCGLAYGIAVHAFMNLIVLPLSRVNFRTPPVQFHLVMIAIHMVCVGLPIALAVHRAVQLPTSSSRRPAPGK
jgi:hypothetical protein